jgi:nitrogenase subunit NifH
MSDDKIRQIAFYGKGSIGKSTTSQKSQLLTGTLTV